MQYKYECDSHNPYCAVYWWTHWPIESASTLPFLFDGKKSHVMILAVEATTICQSLLQRFPSCQKFMPAWIQKPFA